MTLTPGTENFVAKSIKNASAGGQLEQPSDVKSSTTTGTGVGAGPDRSRAVVRGDIARSATAPAPRPAATRARVMFLEMRNAAKPHDYRRIFACRLSRRGPALRASQPQAFQSPSLPAFQPSGLSSSPSPLGLPAKARRENPLEQRRVGQAHVDGRLREVLGPRDLGIRVRLEDEDAALGVEPEIDASVAAEIERLVHAARDVLHALERPRRQVFRRRRVDAHPRLVLQVPFHALGSD